MLDVVGLAYHDGRRVYAVATLGQSSSWTVQIKYPTYSIVRLFKKGEKGEPPFKRTLVQGHIYRASIDCIAGGRENISSNKSIDRNTQKVLTTGLTHPSCVINAR